MSGVQLQLDGQLGLEQSHADVTTGSSISVEGVVSEENVTSEFDVVSSVI